MTQFSLTLLLFLLSSCAAQEMPDLKEGDILFQRTASRQSNAIALATHSEYTHTGMLLEKGGKLMVFEAVGPVKYTELDRWMLQGNDKVVIRRLKDQDKLTPSILSKMRSTAEAYNGRRYDIAFNWSDEELYCSELVWKIYEDALGVKLGAPRPMKEFDLTSAEVKRVMSERYGEKIPLNEPMISPQQVYESDLLETVYSK
jgi:uncharacterized protein YycO